MCCRPSSAAPFCCSCSPRSRPRARAAPRCPGGVLGSGERRTPGASERAGGRRAGGGRAQGGRLLPFAAWALFPRANSILAGAPRRRRGERSAARSRVDRGGGGSEGRLWRVREATAAPPCPALGDFAGTSTRARRDGAPPACLCGAGSARRGTGGAGRCWRRTGSCGAAGRRGRLRAAAMRRRQRRRRQRRRPRWNAALRRQGPCGAGVRPAVQRRDAGGRTREALRGGRSGARCGRGRGAAGERWVLREA